MSHWLLDTMANKRRLALREADRMQFYREMGREVTDVDEETLREVAAALEIAVLDLEVDRLADDPEQHTLLRQSAEDAFRILRMLPLPTNPMDAGTHLLRASVLAVLGDRGADAARWLRSLDESQQWPDLPLDAPNWGERCRATLTDVWLRLVRKKGWSDRDAVLERVADLRSAQQNFEQEYLYAFEPLDAKRSALELIAIYHLAKAADVLAHYITDGVVDGSHQIQPVLDSHFDRAIEACDTAQLIELGPLTRLLARAAQQMADIPAVAITPMSMAWDVTSHDIDAALVRPDRSEWGRRLSYCQWLPEEIESGEAWAHLRKGALNGR